MSWSKWLAHFETSAKRPLPKIVVDEPVPAPALVARSLAIFQRGETGEGRIAKEIWKVDLPGIDDDYRRALGLFIREEGRHARVVASMVRSLGGELLGETGPVIGQTSSPAGLRELAARCASLRSLRASWREQLFVKARRLAGVRTKLLVLLVAEVVAITFYGLIADALPKGTLKSALEEIVGDETQHLAFHVDFFSTQATSDAKRRLFRAAFMMVGHATGRAVAFDHRETLLALGILPAAATSMFVAQLHEVCRRVEDAPTRTSEMMRCAS